jgi:hypothetical protein
MLPDMKTSIEGNKMAEGINIEHHDHDYHPKGYGYRHDGAVMGFGWGIVAFIAFLVVIWAVWSNHNRCSDQHLVSVRAMDQVGYQAGYVQKQLNDMQYTLNNQCNKDDHRYDENLRFGNPVGNHTQTACYARKGYGYGQGSVINGSPINESHTFASENSAFG